MFGEICIKYDLSKDFHLIYYKHFLFTREHQISKVKSIA